MLLLFPALFCCVNLKHGYCAPSPAKDKDILIKALAYTENNPETLAGLIDDAVAEGDMLLQSNRNAADRQWPSTKIPYKIDSNLGFRTNDIEAALNMINFHTCLSFHKRTSEVDYLNFKDGFGCASYVGFMGGRQDVHVGKTCRIGNIVHEVLHALGFYHEHTRMDRGKYITIVSANILPGHHKNFRKQIGETFQLAYDLSSIMHYGRTFFSANGRPTIVAKVKANNMGQRVGMTATDVRRVRLLYKCDQTGGVVEPQWLEPAGTSAALINVHLNDVINLRSNTTRSLLVGARNTS
ncbi:astacin-like metalloendopeptidase [Syngnathoides biaculeatus]|uniref:astacin-like metalloendopeptidase n=1 Tax=Syngnathoides biaculeatus TaxID=300417 RepID=UPI002ADE812D|nr:astacin-like metalloendopeptidase [Syngnathoides biaculeatus]